MWNRYKYLFILLLVVFICLLATIFGIRGLWQAWQNGRWDDSYWIESFTLQVCAPLMSVLSSSVGLTLYFSRRANEKAKGQQGKPANRKISTMVIAFSPLLLIVLFAATAFGLQTYEPYSYNTLLAQIQTHKPLFYDALRASDNNWTIHTSAPAVNVGPSTYGYADGSYQLQGMNTPTLTAPGIYGDVAVEVTVRLLGKQSPDDQYDSFGLLLHNDGFGLNGVSFNISPDGTGIWEIGPLFETFASSNAIHTAPGASNRLAVIMRGHQDILYINNQFVGIYQDSGPTTGPLGFEAVTDTASAAFTNFTIYPL